jgi:hypothetical protein
MRRCPPVCRPETTTETTCRHRTFGLAPLIWAGRDSAYATVVQSIHCLATPDLGTALAEIRRSILTIQEFPSRGDYVAAMLPYGCRDEAMLGNAWTAELDCAMRAQRTLPAELVAWLVSLDCARW